MGCQYMVTAIIKKILYLILILIVITSCKNKISDCEEFGDAGIDPKNSGLAKTLKIKEKGYYALKVR